MDSHQISVQSSPKLELCNVSMTFQSQRGQTVQAIDTLSLTVQENDFISIVGPSGCGKSTLLKMVAGLTQPTSGMVLLDGQAITDPGAERGMVFQTYTLFPWLTVQRNVEYGSRMQQQDKATRTLRAQSYIDLVGLRGFEQHYAKELSGGMMQRVAIARALANDPEVLLMDEPFGALDAQTRTTMQELLLDIWESNRKTVIFVTHDIDEAVLLSNRVHVMTARPGKFKMVLEVDLPRPRTVQTAILPEFIAMKRQLLAAIREESYKAQMVNLKHT